MKLEAPVICQNCNKSHKVKFENMRPGKTIRCSCGATIRFEGDDMRKAQKAFDKLNKTLKSLGK